MIRASGNELVVQPDGEGPGGAPRLPVTVNVRQYDKVELGYAVTVFRSQGGTFDASYVLLGGPGTSRQMAYVVGSRERDNVRFYADRFEAGYVLEKLSRGEAVRKPFESPLARGMAASVEKRLAHDLPEREPGRQPAGPRHEHTQGL